MTADNITDRLFYFFGHNRMNIERIYLYEWESDFITITRAGYVVECEVKVSRADFLRDLKKGRRHRILQGSVEGNAKQLKRPNRFFYVMPEGMCDPSEVPEYCGLITVRPGRRHGISQVRPSQILHRDKFDSWEYMAEKFFYKTVSYRSQIRRITRSIR